MITKTVSYPGDPDTKVILMFGEEFQEKVRMGLPGKVKIEIIGGVAEEFEVRGILCDTCSAEIHDDEPLALIIEYNRVYCWPCHMNLNGPYLVRSKK